jgi:LemA protein
MKKSTIIILAVVAVVVLWAISAYNGLVSKEESVNNQWANVETVYQRRADLIPQLVNTVKGYASHEKTTLQAVVDARTKATQMTVNIDDLSEENLRKFQQAQGEVSSALSRLLAITESYPDLKANENFSELQAQLEGTENRIAEARKSYNNVVNSYNVALRTFPTSILSGLFGFERKAAFSAAEGAEKAPEVSFD